MSGNPKDILLTPIEYLKGVGPQKSELLKKELGIFRFRDLLYHFPFRYIDRTKFHKIKDLTPSNAFIQVKARLNRKEFIGKGRKQRLVAYVEDDTGELELVWFRGVKWIDKILVVHREYVIFGKPTLYNHSINIAHPEIEPFTDNHQATLKLQPIYSSTEKLAKSRLDSRGLLGLQKNLREQIEHRIPENLPPYIQQKTNLISHQEALRLIHFPEVPRDADQARRRLTFEELFFHQLKLLKHKFRVKNHIPGKVLQNIDRLNAFYANHLPFDLTNAQKRVIKEIYHDMCSGKQMNRLLQGDVGSGKTIVAFICMLITASNEGQACIMAPTEILAEQHYNGLQPFCEAMGLRIDLLTGSTKSARRQELLAQLKTGELNFIVGTHALIEDRVQFNELNLCIIDEQHRFGVEQRGKLTRKNQSIPPHVLVMTATPIPRTLAMSFYGDLDSSVIDEMPAGRKPIQTVHRFENKRLAVFGFIREQLKAGRQAYIVYPLIEESEKMDLNNLYNGYEAIDKTFGHEYNISIVHGKMKPADKDLEMRRFANNDTQIMVATTVIEVGINVPNASVMVIENAERFGLAQLHQLRGRVGRGAEQSFCILMTGYKLSSEAKIRLETMVRTNNGFEIADIDLQLRGPGEILGKRQSGALELKLANLTTDAPLLKQARGMAREILEEDTGLDLPKNKPLRTYLDTFFRDGDYGRIG